MSIARATFVPVLCLALAGCAAHSGSVAGGGAAGGAVVASSPSAEPSAGASASAGKGEGPGGGNAEKGAGGTAGGTASGAEGGTAGGTAGGAAGYAAPKLDPRETHLSNLRQLTFGGENAEAYYSFDGKRLSMQSTRDGLKCDQIFTMAIDGSDVHQVSTGKGTTTCSYYTPDGESVIYASTHLGSPDCPLKPDMSHGYTWALYADYDIFKVNLKSGALTRLTETAGYDAEATISPDGKTVIFTSVRDGDIDLYTMDLDGKHVKRITSLPGYDGGAFFSHDSKKIVWRASRPEGAALEDFKSLLSKGLVRPSRLDLYVSNADGTGVKRLTDNKAANFGPYFLPDDSGVIFASNMDDPQGRDFELYTIKLDGTGLTRITYSPTFDGFPIFSPDGRQLVFASNRNGKAQGETDVFVADWTP